MFKGIPSSLNLFISCRSLKNHNKKFVKKSCRFRNSRFQSYFDEHLKKRQPVCISKPKILQLKLKGISSS